MFTEKVLPEAVELVEDRSHDMGRAEVRCRSQLGHVFDDGPRELVMRQFLDSR
jgi:peptide-methionine (R)-S-oxide reductase